MENDEMLRMRLSKGIKEQLQKMADKENRKLSDYIRLELIKLIEKSKNKK